MCIIKVHSNAWDLTCFSLLPGITNYQVPIVPGTSISDLQHLEFTMSLLIDKALQNLNVSLKTIQLLLKEHPKALCKREDADYILEQAFTLGVSLPVIQFLVESDFHLNTNGDHYPDTCLHRAITCCTSFPVVKFPTEKWLDAVQRRGDYG